MGFSVSSAGAILFISLFVTFGLVYSAVSNSAEQVTDAERASSDEFVDQKNTAITVGDATWNASNSTLTVTANNTGATTLTLEETELLVDNAHVNQSSFDVLTIDGSSSTELWLPGETLRIQVSLNRTPSRVTVVTAHGIADSEVI